MLELFNPNPPVDVAAAEYQRLLGFPRGYVLEGRARELADGTREWFGKHGKPWIYARQVDSLKLSNERLTINGAEFSSKQLHDQFATTQARTAVLTAVSAGKECEEKARELWHEGKPDEYFFMEVFGSAVVENLITIASGHICGWADNHGMVALPHYSPGYSGWDVADQNKLWSLFHPQKDHGGPGELHVLESGMLRPKKSLLAVFGVTANMEQSRPFAKLVPCENCALPDCQYRRTPYKHSPPQIEDVHRIQGDLAAGQPDSVVLPSFPPPKYSINARALRKWSQERLWLSTMPDGSVEARFRYEGTTCSNMGRPLAYDYHVRLQPPEEQYRIVSARCAPAVGDSGHASQCAHQTDGNELQRQIEREVPLLGRSLQDVFTWERPLNPAGCYCEPAARLHKWGLIFEVIHFALAEQQKSKSKSMTTVANQTIKTV